MTPFQPVGFSLPHFPLMRHVVAALLLAGMLLTCIACSTVSHARASSDSPKGGDAGLPLTPELIEGKDLYERRCGTCHELYSPRDYSPAAWPRYVKRYGPRSGLRPSDREKVTAYLQAAAAR